MKWVAKNDITGQTYGKIYDNVYDCQKYIDTELVKLQFLYGMIVGLEKDLKEESEFDKWYKENYKGNLDNIAVEIMARFQYAIKDLFNGLPRNPRNNVIRAYYIDQERFADGFDF